MLSDGAAQFTRDRMTVLFSKESIWDLDVQEEDVLSVLIKNEGENKFSIAVTCNGEFVEEFKDLQIQVPLSKRWQQKYYRWCNLHIRGRAYRYR